MHVIFRAGIRLTMVAAGTVAATSSHAYLQLVAFGDILTFDVNPAFLAVSRHAAAAERSEAPPLLALVEGGRTMAEGSEQRAAAALARTGFGFRQQMAAAVPEPSTWVLSFTGLLALGLATRRRALKPVPVSCP